jgi:hypothetical protein
VNHQPHVVKYQYASRLRLWGAHEKDKKHAHYLTEGDAIGFTFESMGGISESAMKFINHLYANGRGNCKHNWDSESHETRPQEGRKEFMDRLSMVLCHHRVCDYKFLGIPNARANGATFVNSPTHSRPRRFTVSRPVEPGISVLCNWSLILKGFPLANTSRAVGNRFEVFFVNRLNTLLSSPTNQLDVGWYVHRC